VKEDENKQTYLLNRSNESRVRTSLAINPEQMNWSIANNRKRFFNGIPDADDWIGWKELACKRL